MRKPYQPPKSEIKLTPILHALSDPNGCELYSV